ncbi:MAG: U32 family peptidase [Desulfuromonadales bacterium]|nr:U32 family peptidase [Desulfuromonadales bacterium]
MRIISPIDNAAEVVPLLAAGADELYGGYVPSAWQERYRLLASLNQRTFAGAQIESEAELAEIIAALHEQGKTFSLTLNAPFYDDRQLPLVLDYVGRMAELGVDGIILADLVLLAQLRQRFPVFEYHASTLAHLTNAAAVRFYVQQGIQRAVLPRHLTVAELEAIATGLPEIRFDAFMLVGKCANTEGLCSFHHSSPDEIWPCEIPYSIAPCHPPGSANLNQAMERQALWSRSNRRHGCGLCALPALSRIGIHGVKLVGRGAATRVKIRNVKLVKEFIALSAKETDPKVFQRRARDAHSASFGSPCCRNVCYYPEFLEEK